MTRETVDNVLASKITDGRITIGTGITVEIDSFVTLFSECDWDYESLIAADADPSGETIGKGYKPFFDQCKADGLLS